MKPLALLALLVPLTATGFEVKHLYELAGFTGPLPLKPANLSFDAGSGELLVTGENVVRVFSPTGMEVYSFEPDPSLGSVYDVAALEGGDLLALSYPPSGGWALTRCDQRGRPKGRLAVQGVPAELAEGFEPNVLEHANGKLYVASERAMKVLVLDLDGRFAAGHDLAALAELADKRAETGLNGFGVDAEGNVFFTIPTEFRVFVLSPSGELRSWGKSGGAPGRFNVIAGVGHDGGRWFVADTLKGAVIVFDDQLQFVTEFGPKGRSAGLSAPTKLLATHGKVFVAQAAGKGVSVFSFAP